MQQIIPCKQTRLLVLMILILLICVSCGKEEEELPELGYTIEECINKDNFNDWKIGITVESPELRSQVIPVPFYRASMIMEEGNVELSSETNLVNYEMTSEYIEQRNTAWSVLAKSEFTKEYVERYEYVSGINSLIRVEPYVIVYHCWNDWKSDEEGNVVGADGVIFIYEEETEEIEYLAFIYLTQNYVFDSSHSVFWAGDAATLE